MSIKHIFSDMDNSDGYISEENTQLIQKADIPLTLISARAPFEMDSTIKAKFEGFTNCI